MLPWAPYVIPHIALFGSLVIVVTKPLSYAFKLIENQFLQMDDICFILKGLVSRSIALLLSIKFLCIDDRRSRSSFIKLH